MTKKFTIGDWNGISNQSPKSFICWHCNNRVSSEKAYASYIPAHYKSYIFICPHCNAPNIYDDENKQVMLPLPGEEIKKLPELIEKNYDEIRKCMQSGCFNAAIMMMRKMIMNLAVEEGAEEGKTFVEYINFLCDEGVVPKKSKSKADSVRDLGNSANHEIEDRSQQEAENCFEFIELLLKVNYEFSDDEENEVA